MQKFSWQFNNGWKDVFSAYASHDSRCDFPSVCGFLRGHNDFPSGCGFRHDRSYFFSGYDIHRNYYYDGADARNGVAYSGGDSGGDDGCNKVLNPALPTRPPAQQCCDHDPHSPAR
jgi:hypothetical protein